MRDILSGLGIKTWMDIAGGMTSDIYESMAKGVQGSSALLCFMTQARAPPSTYLFFPFLSQFSFFSKRWGTRFDPWNLVFVLAIFTH